MTMQPPTDETVLEGDEEAHEVGSSSEASSPKRIFRSKYSQAVGQALWSGRMRWGDSLPEDLVPSRDEYPDATWPTWTEDESDPAASGSGHAVELEVPAEMATHVEQETNEEPEGLKRDDPEHEMMPGGNGLRPGGWHQGQQLRGDGRLGFDANASTPTSATGGDSPDAGSKNSPAVWTMGPMGSHQLGGDHARIPIWHVFRSAGGDGLRPGGSDVATGTCSRCDIAAWS